MLSDGEIKEKVKTGELIIDPFDEKCLQPASYDLHLGNHFKIYKSSSEIIDPKKPVSEMMEDIFIEEGDYFVLHPGCFALGVIKEETGVDAKHIGRLEGKSSIARLGLMIHITAGFLDPGNSVNMTLEFFNASPLPIKLYPGMKIAQMAFDEMKKESEKPYGARGLNSKYLGDDKTVESKMHLNFK